MATYIIKNGELYHHGIKGMRWGVRRYQNADGSLTEQGQKRYGKMSDDKLRKTLHKQVKQTRSDQSNWANQWLWDNAIGEHSKTAHDKYDKAWREYMNSDAVKKAKKRFEKIARMYSDGKLDPDNYDAHYDAEYDKIRKSIQRLGLDGSVTFTEEGRVYSQAYLDTFGKDITIGYLKDLGYNDVVAEEFTKRILNSKVKQIN